jgi:hypothetical protein
MGDMVDIPAEALQEKWLDRIIAGVGQRIAHHSRPVRGNIITHISELKKIT